MNELPDFAVSCNEREAIKTHTGVCLWFTGLSGSGKTTLANYLEMELNKKGVHTYLLDGDNIRLGLNADLGFSEIERRENIRRVGEVARLFVDAGIVVLAAFISPYERDRNKVRQIIPEGKFIEVFVDTDISVCEKRDPKGLYMRARKNEIKEFTGISAPYEKPSKPELCLVNNNLSDFETNIQILINLLSERKFIMKEKN